MKSETKLLIGWHFLFLALSYYALAFATHFTFHFAELSYMDHYTLQANGFWHLKPYLLNSDGSLPKILDTANFQGLSFGVYGPFPAVFQLILNNILGLNIYTPRIVYSLTMTCLYIFFWLSRDFFSIIMNFKEETSILLAGALCTCIGLTDRFLQDVVIGFSWTQASVTSQIFLLLSLWCLIRFKQNEKNGLLLCSGIFTGLACLGKQNYIFSFIPTLYFIFHQYQNERLKKALYYFAPVLAAVGVVLAWNFIRFGNPFDSGLIYVNSDGTSLSTASLPQIHRIPLNFFNHFLARAYFSTSDFPLLAGMVSTFGDFNNNDGSGGLLHNFQMISMFVSSPILLTVPIYGAWLLFQGLEARRLSQLNKWWIFFMAINVCVFSYYLVTDSPWSRYQFDIWFLSYLCAAVALIKFFQWVKKNNYRTVKALTSTLVALALLFSVFTGIDQTMGLLVSREYPFIYTQAYARPSDFTLQIEACMVRSYVFGLDKPCLPHFFIREF
jgi:hypothetical protein